MPDLSIKYNIKGWKVFTTICWANPYCLCVILFHVLFITSLHAQRVPVLNQIDLPHNYYFRELYLPQLTSGPSSVCWSPDGQSLIFSMSGSLWKQNFGSETAEQLTDGNSYDYQPDWSPDGNRIILVRYNGVSIELMLLDLLIHDTIPVTNNKAVNLEPRWSPDGKFILMYLPLTVVISCYIKQGLIKVF